MWLSGSQPWEGDLPEFHERMSGRLQRNMQARLIYEDEADHRNLVADTKSLVDILTEMLSKTSTLPAMRFRLRTLMVALTLGPIVLGLGWLHGDLPIFWILAILVVLLGLGAAWSLHTALSPRE